MDRVKAQATQLAEQGRAQAAQLAEQGKAKVDQVQSSRRADQMLRQLGGLVYAERTGRAVPDSQAKIDQLISDLSAFERESGVNVAADPTGQSTTGQSTTGQSTTGQPNVPPQQNPSGGPPPGSGSGGPEEGGSAFGQSFFPGPDDSPPNG